MHRSAFRLFVLLLAWCVGFQSTAVAIEMPCAQGQAAMMESDAAMPASTHDGGMSMSMDHAHPSAQQHHPMGDDSQTSPDDPAKVTKAGCGCGCNCLAVGCVGGGPGIADLTSNGVFPAAPAAFVLQEALSSLRAAHVLDLIRPPSRS
jgi:hypothetical protein